MNQFNLPKDVEARLIQASTELLREQKIDLPDAGALRAWMVENAAAIGQRAKRAIDLQLDMFVKYKDLQREIDSAISESVYHTIRARNL